MTPSNCARRLSSCQGLALLIACVGVVAFVSLAATSILGRRESAGSFLHFSGDGSVNQIGDLSHRVAASHAAAEAACLPAHARRQCRAYNHSRVSSEALLRDSDACEAAGCCFDAKSTTLYEVPCYERRRIVAGYHVRDAQSRDNGADIYLDLYDGESYMADDTQQLYLNVTLETSQRLHLHWMDVNRSSGEWQTPIDVRNPVWTPPLIADSPTDFEVHVIRQPFGLVIFRKSTQEVLFNTSIAPVAQQKQQSGLIYSSDYIELSTSIGAESALFGLSEHENGLRLQPSDTRPITLWASDSGEAPDRNEYGVHPFYLQLNAAGQAHGVYMHNSVGMDIVYTADRLTYRMLGGGVNMYFFLGPSPLEVVQQYTEVIGRAVMPPDWAFGYHQCRWGYESIEQVEETYHNLTAANLPIDVMWLDIDYMDEHRDFTLGANFSHTALKKFSDKLHTEGRHLVVILDPAIPILTEQPYQPYTDGIANDVFIHTASDDSNLVGRVWPPEPVHFPSFASSATEAWWQRQIAPLVNELGVDGIWIDMNEASNFCDGACTPTDDAESDEEPAYRLNNKGDGQNLNKKAISLSAVHPKTNYRELNVHNLYGFYEARATYKALQAVQPSRRPFILTRSSFSGSSRYAAHWLGDNISTWNSMAASIASLQSMSLMGFTMVGADLCGFAGDTTEELCARWMAMGAFVPFARNHNMIGQVLQEPYRWESVRAITERLFSYRASLLPYLVTNAAEATLNGTIMLRPLFVTFPEDVETHSIEAQYMLGGSLLVTPVPYEGKAKISTYLPPSAVWYNGFTWQKETELGWADRDAALPDNPILIHWRGGSIVPRQVPALSTALQQHKAIRLQVFLDQHQQATGHLFADDGESLPAGTNATRVLYRFSNNTLTSNVLQDTYANSQRLVVNQIHVVGLSAGTQLEAIHVNAVSMDHEQWQYDIAHAMLTIDLVKPLTINQALNIKLRAAESSVVLAVE